MRRKTNPKTNQRYTALMLIPIILLSMAGFAYAQWNDIIVINSTMEFGALNMGFVEPLTCTDNEATKDVGKLNCYYDDLKTDIETGKQAYATLIIDINNAYPDYEVHCTFTLENIGTLPLHIKELITSDPTNALTWDATLGALVDATGKPILIIVITPDPVCKNLWPQDDPDTPETEPTTLEAEIAIQITQNAEECHTYYFLVQITYEQVT